MHLVLEEAEIVNSLYFKGNLSVEGLPRSRSGFCVGLVCWLGISSRQGWDLSLPGTSDG